MRYRTPVVAFACLLAAAFLLATCGVGPPAVPHPVAGRDDCRSCHEAGRGDASRFPQDHRSRGNSGCDDCHFLERR